MKELLIKLDACQRALEWAGDKTWVQIYNTCHRGDWLLWLHYHTNKEDLKIRTLAKGHCANTVRHLMTDKRSLKAVDTAIAFGEGRATMEELSAASDDSLPYYIAAYAAYAAHAAAPNYGAYTAAYITAKVENQKETADIVRRCIPIELWNTQKMIDEIKLKRI